MIQSIGTLHTLISNSYNNGIFYSFNCFLRI